MLQRRTIVRFIPIPLVFALVVTTFTPSFATESPSDNQASPSRSSVSGVLDQVGDHAPDLLWTPSAAATSTADATVLNTQGGKIEIPRNAKDGVQISTRNGISIGISLPNAQNSSQAAESVDGSFFYPSTEPTTDAVIANATGVQLLNVISDSSAPKTYEYKFDLPPSYYLTESSITNEVDIVDETGSAVAHINAPWAKDAQGKDVTTYYTVHAGSLIQTILPDESTIFPVVADPSTTLFWWGTRVTFTRSETKTLARSTSGAELATPLCGFAGGVNVIAAVGCGVVAAALMLKINVIRSAANKNGCAQIDSVWTTMPALWNVRDTGC